MNLREKPFHLTEEEESRVLEKVKTMTAEEKAGQVFCVMATGRSPQEELTSLVRDYHVGGILYRPVPTDWLHDQYEKLDALTDIPLLKAANLEEGGSGAVSDGTFFSWPMGIAATNDPEYAEKSALICAQEGRAAGVNWTFSPVADINYEFQNPITHIRTFGSDPEKVKTYTLAYMKTLQENGIAACAKHFPGDGVDFRDQHLHPTYNSLSAEDWYATYGMVYKTMIDEGLMSIMAGHIVQPNVAMDINPDLRFEDCLPGSLCHELLDGVLRRKMNFNGLIATDATIMTGFIQAMPRKKAIPFAIEAGIDMLVFTTSFYDDYHYILDGLADGTLSMQRLDDAVTRVLALKTALAHPVPMPQIDPAQKKQWVRDCAENGITMVKNIADFLPLNKERFPKVELTLLGDDKLGEGGSLLEAWRTRLTKEGFEVSEFVPIDGHPGKPKLQPDCLKIHIANIGAISNNTAVRLYWKQMGAQNEPKYVWEQPGIFVSFANPYHLQDVPRVRTYINCYNNSQAAVDTVIDLLLGRGDFKGTSPVDAFCGLPDTRI